MPQHIACLTYDFDALSLWIARGMTTPTPLSRGEFGVVGTERILDLLARYDIKATFFIPGHTLESCPEICKRVAGEGLRLPGGQGAEPARHRTEAGA